MRYASKRRYDWSAAIAYSVGLMASDGCLQKDGRHLDLTSADIEQLTNFAKALGRNLHISRKRNGAGQPAWRVQFSDVAYYDFLAETGLTPAKSITLGSLNIPDAFYPDFLRGLFDGDGTTYGYTDVRWRSSFMFYTSFASASPAFMQYIRQTNERLANVTPGALHEGKRAYNLTYAKADSRKLRYFMYHRDDVLCLTRKRAKLEGFIRSSQNAIIPSVTREW